MMRQLGYCTNVHAGPDLDATRRNLERYALEVKRRVSPDRPMGIGLWLSASAAEQLIGGGDVAEFRDWLANVGLVPFTFNGFPHGDFHQAKVKHRVYQPTWFDQERLRYTLNLIDIQHALLPDGLEGSISTLPIAWKDPAPTADQWARAAGQLDEVARRLERLERETGRLIHVCLEPEPGCVIQYARDVVRFFKDHLLTADNEEPVRRHIRVCHDICHAAVMFEEQRDVIGLYRRHGIGIGKVQVSSAIHLQLAELADDERREAIEQLAGFAEDRYLHQTMFRGREGRTEFHEDLPGALQAAGETDKKDSEMRVHFHVPIYLERFGRLTTSQPQIRQCMAALESSATCHFEVETYAWGVLPEALRQPDLAEGIAEEMTWLLGEAWRDSEN